MSFEGTYGDISPNSCDAGLRSGLTAKQQSRLHEHCGASRTPTLDIVEEKEEVPRAVSSAKAARADRHVELWERAARQGKIARAASPPLHLLTTTQAPSYHMLVRRLTGRAFIFGASERRCTLWPAIPIING